jgi:dienelactone hydrolase
MPVDSVRERIAEFIGLEKVSEHPPIQIVDRQSDDGYTRSLLQYWLSDGDVVEAFLFEAERKNSKAGVLVLHQHNSQWTIGKSEVAGLAGDPMQAFGPALARRGVTVLAPDAIGFESRLGMSGWGTELAPTLTRPGGFVDGWLQYYNQMAHRLVQGDLLIRKMLSDCMAAISVLESINSEGMPIGAIGHSLGGGLALFLAALDTRVAFTCSSGAACSFRHKLAHGTGLEMSLIIPGFAKQFDIEDVVRCIAPRKIFVVSSEDDAVSADADDVVQRAKGVFEEMNCSECLEHLRGRGGHALDRHRFNAIVDWTLAQCHEVG